MQELFNKPRVYGSKIAIELAMVFKSTVLGGNRS